MPKTTTDYALAIKRINAQYRKLKDLESKTAAKLRDRKDALIDAMQAKHRHRTIYETSGSPSNGRLSLGGGPQRICAGCGLAEQPSAPDGYQQLASGRVIDVVHGEYKIRQGLILKRLGINL